MTWRNLVSEVPIILCQYSQAPRSFLQVILRLQRLGA